MKKRNDILLISNCKTSTGNIFDVDNDSTSYSLPDEYSKIIAVRDRNYDELEPLTEVDEGDNDSVAVSRARDIDDDIL